MTIEERIGDEKLWYNIYKDAAKIWISHRRSIKTNIYRKNIITKKFGYSPLAKAFKKQKETIKNVGREQMNAFQIFIIC